MGQDGPTNNFVERPGAASRRRTVESYGSSGNALTRMDIEFAYRGELGSVSVSCVPVEDAAAIGKDQTAWGFPMCSATVAYTGHGYRALFGWVQLVRSSDNESGGTAFEIDPLKFFEDSSAPYCWFGVLPTLFDAPSRDERNPLLWVAHSFLAASPWDVGTERQVVPLLGFSWGFEIELGGRITLLPERRLSAAEWAAHIPYLSARYPTWLFPSPDAF
jgi:hypothetical protein